jgi:hypothetical protein
MIQRALKVMNYSIALGESMEGKGNGGLAHSKLEKLAVKVTEEMSTVSEECGIAQPRFSAITRKNQSAAMHENTVKRCPQQVTNIGRITSVLFAAVISQPSC